MWKYKKSLVTSNQQCHAKSAHTPGAPVTGEFPSQRPVTRSFDVFFDLRLNKRLSNPSRRRRFETPWCSSWHHCNDHQLHHPAPHPYTNTPTPQQPKPRFRSLNPQPQHLITTSPPPTPTSTPPYEYCVAKRHCFRPMASTRQLHASLAMQFRMKLASFVGMIWHVAMWNHLKYI